MKVLLPLVVVVAASLSALFLAGAGLQPVFGIVIPYAAIATFLAGIVWRVVRWARSPVPFRIPTTCGQQKSLDFIRQDRLDNPFTGVEAFGRMALEVLLFRSLFRNTSARLTPDRRLVYGSEKYLWAAALAFHWSFLVVFVRHLRFFLDPVPGVVEALSGVDGFFQIGVPVLYLTDLVIVAAVTFLFLRRVVLPQVRYISLASDYFPLFLILGIALTGILMRYFFKTDLQAVKQLAIGLVTFEPVAPVEASGLFYSHLFLVCLLFAYFPFSKLLHMAGVFLSPTRNLANNNRAERHVNPWNPEVKTHSYEEYEAEFHDLMKNAGYPLERE